MEALRELGEYESEADAKRKIAAALDTVAQKLGNTRNVCRKYYVHPLVIEQYTNNTLAKYYNNTSAAGEALTAEEHALLNMLEDMKSAVIAA